MEIKTKFLALDNHQGKEGLSFSPNIVHFNSNKYSSLNNSTFIQKFKCLPNPIYFNSCYNANSIRIFTKSSIIILTTSYNPNNSSSTSSYKNNRNSKLWYCSSLASLTNTVQALVSMVKSVDVQPSTVISTQPQTKYRLWNMLVLQLHLKQ